MTLLTAGLLVVAIVLTAILLMTLVGWRDRRDARRRNR